MESNQSKTKVYAWGIGSDGQLGHQNLSGKSKCCMLPHLVQKQPKGVVAISCYSLSSLSLNDQGQVFGFGNGSRGRIGLGEGNDQVKIPTQVKELVNIVQISAGTFHSLALDSNGQAFSTGCNNYGELGRPTDAKVVSIFGKVE